MSNSIDALKVALELEKLVRNKYQEAVDHAVHGETRDTLKKLIADRDQQVDSLHWVIMAEAGKLEKTEKAPQENGGARVSTGKCPFSAEELAKMGFPVSGDKSHA